MTMIKNPIIRGFNPDPSIIRVEDDYYVVTSTFEWFPGYQIHHSKDLVHWQLINRPLDRVSQLDMAGIPDSCGVWAPCLTHYEGVFYLLYTNVRRFDSPWKDTPNYVVTATDINGPWSEPVYLNSSGFDSSFFHDDDGKTWLVNMIVDHRHDKFFGGIVLQQYCKDTNKLVGDVEYIFEGTERGRTEGPHLYKRNGYYYLLTAEGGTGYEHCMTLARSRTITGPYEVHPENPIISALEQPSAYLQRTGHGDIVETQNGDWYAVFLTGRPLTERGNCITGRETAIEKMEWRDDDWLYLACGGRQARCKVEAPNLPEHAFPELAERLDFDDETIDINFQAPRIPMTADWVNLAQRPGFMRLYGRESLSSCFNQSLVARRVQAHHIETATCVEFEPDNFQQMAGLTCYYNTYYFHYLYIHGDDLGGDKSKKFLNLISVDRVDYDHPLAEPIDITGAERVYLKADFDGAQLQYFYALKQGEWIKVGPVLDGSRLSDEHASNFTHRFHAAFTGAFVGMACQDLSGQGIHADFDWFEYREF
ncbi:glycoside hydrolase family 43 protein [Echinimonas agarilytica]|uniref:Glycoside hydrolase family 43 protein n=1 Tax=Echinimonas agarilytica TaxID=1215918 RepID=A0AA42B9Q0_9GAMM|nr:glycoside hydrolase family 43 protein [Echinimonas agarilytica]MCM2681236.1 glycoside hydrolase family 43 protein [Echinimonas agarilytica]